MMLRFAFILALCLVTVLSMATADSAAEFEERAASAEPFLDRLATALFGKSKEKSGQGKPYKVPNKRPIGPVYRPGPRPGQNRPPPPPVPKPIGPHSLPPKQRPQGPKPRPQSLPPPPPSKSRPVISQQQLALPSFQAPVIAPPANAADTYGAPIAPPIGGGGGGGGGQLPQRPQVPQYRPAASSQVPNVFSKPPSSFGRPPPSASFGSRPSSPSSPFPSRPSASRPPSGSSGFSVSNSRPSFFGDSNSVSSDLGSVGSMAQIEDLQVQCEKDLMRIRVRFDRPFYGMIFSKGHYSDVNCVHVPAGLGQTTATFDIALRSCGMQSSVNDGYSAPGTPQGSFIENTIIVQYDPLLQEVWDQARKLRCTWYDFYEKAVTFKPYQVDMLDPVTANFLGDNLRCWMQIQVGKGPHANEVSGIVKIGQTMTMVLGVKDDENKFDMMVRNCVAHDGLRAPIQLVDEKGCVVRPKIMSPFKKIKNFDATANVLAYAYFQAFKFPDSMNVHFQCVVQVCRGACPEPQCGGNTKSNTNNGDSYGSPQADLSSYSSVNPAISPRIPSLSGYSSAGSEPQVTVVHSDGSPVEESGGALENDEAESDEAESNKRINERISITDSYAGFNRRMGSSDGGDRLSLRQMTGRPRSLDLDKKKETVEDKTDAGVGSDSVTLSASSSSSSRSRRASEQVVLRVRRESHGDSDMEMADLETEKVIQVIAPNDVQFALTSDDKEEVVINTTQGLNEAICIDTSAFVGLTISLLMLFVIAVITIAFMAFRIRSLTEPEAKLL